MPAAGSTSRGRRRMEQAARRTTSVIRPRRLLRWSCTSESMAKLSSPTRSASSTKTAGQPVPGNRCAVRMAETAAMSASADAGHQALWTPRLLPACEGGRRDGRRAETACECMACCSGEGRLEVSLSYIVIDKKAARTEGTFAKKTNKSK